MSTDDNVEMDKVLASVERGQIDSDGMVPDLVPFEDDFRTPWERMPGEPNDWYHIFFEFFLKQGARRSISEAYRRYSRVEKGTGKQASPRWRFHAYRWTWDVRAEAYDEHQRIIEAERWEGRRRELREKEWDTASTMLVIAEEELDQYKASTGEGQETPDGTPGRVPQPRPKLKSGDVARFAEVGSKLGRLATGMATDQTMTISVQARIEEVRKRRWDDALPAITRVLEDPDEDIVEGEMVEKPLVDDAIA